MSKRVFNLIIGMTLFVTCSGLLALSGCGEDKPKNTRIDGSDARTMHDDAGDQKKGHQISPTELDSMRAMKERFKITREEYWDNKGGVLANEFLELWYPVGGRTVIHGMYTFSLLDKARKTFRDVFGSVPGNRLTVKCSASFEEYDKLVGREWWHYSRIEKDKITYQPIPILYQRGLIETAVPREFYEWGIGELSGNRAPSWLKEGLASVLSDEGHHLKEQLKEFPKDPVKMDMKAIESALKKEIIRKDCRLAHYNTFRMVEKMIADYGRDKVVQTVTLMGKGDEVRTAFEKSFQEPYEDVIEKAREFTVER